MSQVLGRTVPWLVFCCALLFASLAHAEGECAAAVYEWTATASRDIKVPLQVHCVPDAVVIRLNLTDAEPYEVEVRDGDGNAFRRAGRFRMQPHLQVPDWDALPAARRVPFEQLAAWIAAHERDVIVGTQHVPPAIRSIVNHLGITSMRAPWLFLLALVGMGWLLHRERRPNPRDAWFGGAVFLIALLMRLVFGPWGPFHINGQGAMWILGAAVNAEETGAYGPGYHELFHSLTRLSPSHADTIIFTANAVFSASVALSVWVIARLCGLDLWRSLLAATLVALDPVAMRIATTESYYNSMQGFVFLGWIAIALGTRAFSESRKLDAGLWLLCAGLVTSQCARIHPASWVPLALSPCVVLVLQAQMRPMQRASAMALAAIVVGVVVLLTSGTALLRTLENALSGQIVRVNFTGLDWRRPGVVLLGVIVLVLVASEPWLVLIGGVHLALAFVLDRPYGMNPLWQLAFYRMLLPAIALGFVAILPASILSRDGLAAAVVGSIVVGFSARAGVGIVRTTYTEQHEFDWFGRWVTSLPTGCRVLYVAFAGHKNVFLPTWRAGDRPAGTFIRLDARAPVDLGLVLGETQCVFYVHSTLCESELGNETCNRVERQLERKPLLQSQFPASTNYNSMLFVRDPVHLEIDKIVRLRAPSPTP